MTAEKLKEFIGVGKIDLHCVAEDGGALCKEKNGNVVPIAPRHVFELFLTQDNRRLCCCPECKRLVET